VKIRVLDEAEAELREAARWYERRVTGLGVRFTQAVVDGFTAIERQPLIYSRPPKVRTSRDVRRLLLHGFPYAIVVKILATEVLVLAIAHGRRRPGYWRKRGA